MDREQVLRACAVVHRAGVEIGLATGREEPDAFDGAAAYEALAGATSWDDAMRVFEAEPEALREALKAGLAQGALARSARATASTVERVAVAVLGLPDWRVRALLADVYEIETERMRPCDAAARLIALLVQDGDEDAIAIVEAEARS